MVFLLYFQPLSKYFMGSTVVQTAHVNAFEGKLQAVEKMYKNGTGTDVFPHFIVNYTNIIGNSEQLDLVGTVYGQQRRLVCGQCVFGICGWYM